MRSFQNFSAQALLRQTALLRTELDTLLSLHRKVDSARSLEFRQWCHLFAMTVDFGPELILEIGRANGGSTAVFTHAAGKLSGCTVKSWCLTRTWDHRTQPALAEIVEPQWFEPLETYVANVRQVDFDAAIGPANRVLLYFDATNHEVNEVILGRILPILSSREHLVVLLGLSDTRYYAHPGDSKNYSGRSYFRGEQDYFAFPDATARAHIWNISTVIDMAVPLIDFCSRNDIPLRYADEDLQKTLPPGSHEEEELRGSLTFSASPDHPPYAPPHRISYFSMNEAEQPYTFPSEFEPRRELDLVLQLVYRLHAARDSGIIGRLMWSAARLLAIGASGAADILKNRGR